MTPGELLTDAFERVLQVATDAVDGLTDEQLATRPVPEANSIAWLVWHLTRVQDDHVADLAGTEQVWTAQGWAERFGLPLPEGDTGYGHDDDAVGVLASVTADLLTGYHDAVHAATAAYLGTLQDTDFD